MSLFCFTLPCAYKLPANVPWVLFSFKIHPFETLICCDIYRAFTVVEWCLSWCSKLASCMYFPISLCCCPKNKMKHLMSSLLEADPRHPASHLQYQLTLIVILEQVLSLSHYCIEFLYSCSCSLTQKEFVWEFCCCPNSIPVYGFYFPVSIQDILLLKINK